MLIDKLQVKRVIRSYKISGSKENVKRKRRHVHNLAQLLLREPQGKQYHTYMFEQHMLSYNA